MIIEVEDRAGISVVRPRGDLNGKDGGRFVQTVTDLLDRNDARVVIDMSAVPMVTSAGLGELVHVTAQANSQGGRVVLSGVTPFVAGVLETTKLDKFLQVCADLSGAFTSLA